MSNEQRITFTYKKDITVKAKARKHIILIDGTWNDETGQNLDGLITNIARMSKILISDENHQIVRYHRGIGNDDENGFLNVLRGGITARGYKWLVDRIYARFVQDWHPGDEIFIFGFSRGAAMARLLAKKINDEGIPESITVTIEPKKNKETKVIEQSITDWTIQTRKNHVPVAIQFLGVWDTVSSFGWKNIFRRLILRKGKDVFTGKTIASNIQRAVHLVAIDETRTPFLPSLMNHDPGRIEEVWFPGVHADIGGGYAEDSIAQVSLHFMLKRLKEYNSLSGLKPFLIAEDMLDFYTKKRQEEWHFHFHGMGWTKQLRNIRIIIQEKEVKPNATYKPKVHRSYEWICKSSHSFSVVEMEEEEKKITKKAPFQYMPYNFKELGEHYEIVD